MGLSLLNYPFTFFSVFTNATYNQNYASVTFVCVQLPRLRAEVMHKIILSIMFLMALSVPSTLAVTPTDARMSVRNNSTETGTVNWLSLSEGLKEAKATGKPILVDIYTDWCGFCHKLDRETLSAPSVASFLSENFVAIRVNAEDGKDGQAFAARHNVRGYPTNLVLDSNGTLLNSIVGFKSAENYLNLLQQTNR
jgi:thiol:disulfide interchange protein